MRDDHPQSALLRLDNVRALNEPKFIFDGMLEGWRNQQASRGLGDSTINARQGTIKRMVKFSEKMPWEWTPGDLEDFSTHVASGSVRLERSTIRSYQRVIFAFCSFIIDPRYPWARECEQRFGVTPQQICHDWNTITHLLDYEGKPAKRPFTPDELEAFFAFADARVDIIARSGKKGSITALRDTQIFKTVYAYGLRRGETVGLDVADFRPNPGAKRYGTYGALDVRYGKGTTGSGPKRRTVITVPELDWIIDGLEQWFGLGRPLLTDNPTGAAWPTERRTRVCSRYLNDRFNEIREGAGLPEDLTPHCLRHTYVTNLIEWGYSEKFVQDQVGHLYAATTAIYTSVGSDYRKRVITDALGRLYGEAND